MKILVVLNSLGIGGAENYTIGLINQFVNMGHSVKLIVLSNDLSLQNRLSSKVELATLPRKWKFDIRVLIRLRHEIKSSSYDAVITSYAEYIRLAMVFTKNQLTTIYPIHSTVPKSTKDDIFRKLLFRFKKSNEIFLTSIDSQTSYLLNRYKLRKSFFEQILNGIDTNHFTLPNPDFDRAAFLSKFAIPAVNKVILMVAGYRPEKRHEDAIAAFDLLQKHFPNVTLLCVGNNNIVAKGALEKHIQDNRINNIVLLSATEAGSVRDYYWACDVFTLTSDKVETFSISALEALSCGLPCVMTNIGGAQDFIKDLDNGYLVQPNNIESIKMGWLHTLNNLANFNKERLRETVVKNYSIDISATKYIELIKGKKL